MEVKIRKTALTEQELDIFHTLIIKPTRCTNFSNLFFEIKTLHVSDSSSVHHQEFFTVLTAMVYVLTACEQDQDRTDPARKLSAHTPLLCVQ